MNWLDIIIIVIFALSGIKGFFTGMVLSLSRLISIISGFIVAFKYYQDLVDYLSFNWHWVDKLAVWFSSWLQNIDFLPLDKFEIPIINKLSWLLSTSLLEIAAFFILFFVTTRIFQWLGAIIARIMSLTLLGPIDRLGGLVFGLIKGFFIIILLLVVLTPLQVYLDIFRGDGKYTYYFVQAWNTSMLLPHFKDFLKLITNLLPGIPFDYINLINI